MKNLEKVVKELGDIVGSENVYTDKHHRALRAATAAPFPLHRWEEHVPDVVVLPKTTDEVVQVVKLANKYRVPLVPRAGGSGLCDGAVPLKKGILIDIKRMSDILEIDEENMCAIVQPGLNMLMLNRELAQLGLWYPDDPASYIVAAVGGRIGTGGWSLLGAGFGHVPDLILNMKVVLPTGDVVTVGAGGGKKIRKSSVGYRLKDLFIGHQGTLGIVTEATVELFPRPEVELAAVFGFSNFEAAHRNAGNLGKSGLKTLTAIVNFDEEKVDFLRRDDEAYIPLPEKYRSVTFAVCYGTEVEVEAAKKVIFKIAREDGGEYLGRELSEGDWASRHERYHIPMHGRRGDGQVTLRSWHCEDAALPYSAVPYVSKRWHEIAKKYVARYDGVFEDYGGFWYTNNPFKPWGDYLGEIDIMINELLLTDETWQAWLDLKRQISEVTLEVGGSISACHGGTRPGDVELVCRKELADGQFELMKKIKKLLDPNNIMNPGKYLLDKAYEEGGK